MKTVTWIFPLLALWVALLAVACGSGGSASSKSIIDDDASPTDDDSSPTADDDISPMDDDASPTDDDDDDNDNDDNDDDDDDDDDNDDNDDDDDNDDSTADPGFVFITHGTFVMGSPVDEVGHYLGADETQHTVVLTHDFELAVFDVTTAEFVAWSSWNPSDNPGCSDCPINMVGWYDALAYANSMSSAAGRTPCYLISDTFCTDGLSVGGAYLSCENSTQNGIATATVALNGVSSVYDCQGFRLPTDAEWEYSARAGTTTPYYDGLGLDEAHYDCEVPFHVTDIAWYCGDEQGGTMPVGGKAPNAWGLYDMAGNVWQWIWDFSADFSGDATDPEGPPTGVTHINRGAGWNYRAAGCRSACRGGDYPEHHYTALGFRLARTLQ